jgi:cytoskeleton protein RodZ
MLLNRRKTLVEGRNLMSSGEAPFDDEPGMPRPDARLGARVGADLRAARERVGWTLPAVSAHLRIRLPFLEAIEEGRIGDLPGNAYAVGFVRTYAQSLGLDPDEIGRRFRAEAAGVNRKTELQFPAPVPERGVPAGAVILVGVVLAICAYIGWYRFSGDERSTAETVQPVPERLAPLASTLPSPAAPATTADSGTASGGSGLSASGTPSIITPGSALSAANTIPVPVPVPVTVPMTPAMYGPPPPQMYGPPAPGTTMPGAPAAGFAATPAGLPGIAAPNVPMPPSGPAPGAAPDGSRIVLRAKADAWIQVRDKSGQVLLNRVLRNGETWPVPPSAKGPLLMTTGNAPGTEMLVDGVEAPPFVGDRSVLRDLPLDPDLIREGKLTAQLSTANATRPAPTKTN